MSSHPNLQDPIMIEFHRLSYLVDQLCKERDDLRTAVAVRERIIEIMTMGLRPTGLTEVAEDINRSHENLEALGRRLSSVESRIDETMTLFQEPEELVGGERQLKPALHAISKALKASLGLNKHTVPKPASAAPVAEWREETTSEDRMPSSCRPTLELKKYFPRAASSRPPPAAVPRDITPAGPSRTRYAGAHSPLPRRQYYAQRIRNARPRLAYHDLDAPAVPSFGQPFPGVAKQDSTDWSALYSGDDVSTTTNARLWQDHHFSHRTVIVDPISRTFSLSTLIQKLHSGYYIESIQRGPSARVSGSELVKINFLCTDDAYEYVQLADIQDGLAGITGVSDAVVKHSDKATGPLSRLVKEAIFAQGATRILMIQNFPARLGGPQELRVQLGYIFHKSLDVLLEDPQFGDKTIRITFRAVADAFRAANRWRKTTDPIWRGVLISFADDGQLPDLSIGDASGNDDGHNGLGRLTRPPGPDSDDDDDDDNDDDDDDHRGPSRRRGASTGPFNFTSQEMSPGPRCADRSNARRARGIAINESHRPILRCSHTGSAFATHTMRTLAEASLDTSAVPNTSQRSASIYSRTTNGGSVNASTSSANNAPSDNAGSGLEQSNSISEQADVAPMPTENGVTGLGVSTVHTPDEVHYYMDGIETDDDGNPLADPDDPLLANIPSHQTIAQSDNTSTTNDTVGNVPVRPGQALPAAVARAMARSRWAD